MAAQRKAAQPCSNRQTGTGGRRFDEHQSRTFVWYLRHQVKPSHDGGWVREQKIKLDWYVIGMIQNLIDQQAHWSFEAPAANCKSTV